VLLIGSLGLSQGSRPLPRRPGLSQVGQASQREVGCLSGRPGLSQGGPAGLSHGGRAFHREAGPLTGRPGLSRGGHAFHRQNVRDTN